MSGGAFRALGFAALSVFSGLLASGCRSAPAPEIQAPVEAEPGGAAEAIGAAPEAAGGQNERSGGEGPLGAASAAPVEQAGISLSSPEAAAAAAPPASVDLPEPGAEGAGPVEVYASGKPPTLREAQALPPPPLPPAASGGGKSAGSKSEAASVSASGRSSPSSPAAKTQPGDTAPAESPTPQERRREVLARKGDTVSIELEGRGWLFLGLPSSGRDSGLSFLSADVGGPRSAFSFKAREYGDYDLAFQLQDNTRGLLQNQIVRLRVLPDDQFREAVARQTAAPPPARPDPAELEAAERLFALRAFDLALPEYLKSYREGEPLLNDRLAVIYAETGEPEAAVKYYQKNLSAPEPYGERAVAGLIRAGLALGSEELVHGQLRNLLGVRALPIGEELLNAARFLMERGRPALALELLQEYLRRYDRSPGLDRAWFLLARLYELESSLRDIAKARAYYEKLYDGFPESPYAAEARARIRYLDRYFFNVQ